MTQRTPIVLNADSRQHIPLADGDTIRPGDIPVSASSGNTIQVRGDGLYVGAEAAPEYARQYVDVVNGDDTNGDGTQTNPYKTIARAVNNMVPGTSGYTVYCHEGQEHVIPSRVVQGIAMNITSYPSLQETAELQRRIQQAWFTKYNALLTTVALDGVFELATLVPDRVNALDKNSAGGPYGWVCGLVSTNGNITFNSVRLKCGRRDMDVDVNGMLRAALLCDYDLQGPVSYNINYSEVILGSMPLLVQRGAGSNSTLNVYATSIKAVDDTEGSAVYIKGWGSDAPRVTAMIGGISDGSQFVNVDGVDYHMRVTSGAVETARDHTTGVVYHGDAPVTIDAAFLYKNS